MGTIKKLKRSLAYTATWAAGILTLTTPTPHYLKNGDVVDLVLTEITRDVTNKVITYVNANVFTIPLDNYAFTTSAGYVVMYYYSGGMTGESEVFRITPSSQNQGMVVQFTAHGTGGAVFVLNVSNDLAGWIPIATVTLASTDLATDFVIINNNWNHAKLTITSITAPCQVVVTTAT